MLQYAMLTNSGGRQLNEDSANCFVNGTMGCFVVCDGLGGHGMGDVASALVTNTFGQLFAQTTNPECFLPQAFTLAQELLQEKQAEQGAKNKMKTTAVALVTTQTTAYIGHIGDSRLYLFRKNKAYFRTVDHSLPQTLAFTKQIEESQIRNHAQRNQLLRAMGMEWERPMYELLAPLPIENGDAFLLCSDGFWELIEESTMEMLLKKSSTPEEWLQSMQQVVEENGKEKNMDNYTAIALWKGSKRKLGLF